MNSTGDEYISLKNIILTIKDYVSELLLSWKLIAIIALLCALYFGLRTHWEDDKYVATLSYMLEDSEGTSMGSITGLLGSFGLGASKGLNRDKLVELSRSDLIIRKTLLDEVRVNSRIDLLANHMIELYEYDKAWAKKENNPLNGFSFKKDSSKALSIKDYSALKQLKSRIVGSPSMGIEGILTSGYNEDSGILELTAVSRNPELSIKLCERLYHNLDSFFVFKTIERQKQNYDVIKAKTDSLTAVLEQTEYALAKFKDTERNLFRRVDKIEERRLENKTKMLYLALGKALENLEIADYSLKYQTPILSIIDQPHLPIGNAKKPLVLDLILGFIFGCILSGLFVVIRKKYREIMTD
jgi:uncharacterized protein involved in exopolysaccharide biosynthesis